MPSHASANPEIKQLYITGHFCYVFKFGTVSYTHLDVYKRQDMELKGLIREALIKMILGFDIALEIEEE